MFMYIPFAQHLVRSLVCVFAYVGIRLFVVYYMDPLPAHASHHHPHPPNKYDVQGSSTRSCALALARKHYPKKTSRVRSVGAPTNRLFACERRHGSCINADLNYARGARLFLIHTNTTARRLRSAGVRCTLRRPNDSATQTSAPDLSVNHTTRRRVRFV